MAEEQNVQAEQQAVDQQADEIASKAIQEAQAEQPTGEQQQEVPSPNPQPDVQALLRDELGKFRGGFADTFGRKVNEMEQKLTERFDSALKPVMDRFQAEEESRVGQLLPEEQVEYWKTRATEPAQQQSPQSQQAAGFYTDAEQNILADEVRNLINQSGVSTHLGDAAVWQGWTQDMSVGQAIKVAETNIQRLKAPQQSAQPQQAQQAAPPAPSTQGAPQKTARSVNTLSEAAALFADGNINSNQYRNIKAQIAKDGSATL